MPEANSIFEIEYIAQQVDDIWVIQGRPLREFQPGEYVGIEVIDESGDLDIVLFQTVVVVPSPYIMPDLERKVEGMVILIARSIDPSDQKYSPQMLAAKHLVAGPD